MKKFLFERSFDDPAKLYLPGERRRAELEAEAAAQTAAAVMKQPVFDAEIPTPPEPIVKAAFTQSQLDAAREEGHIQGHTAALEEAATAREHYVADALSLVAQHLGTLNEQQAAANAANTRDAMRLVYGIARKLLPAAAQKSAIDSISAFVNDILPLAMAEPRLVVRTHSMIVDDVTLRLKDVMEHAGFQGTFVVIADYELQPGDCRVEWDGGGAERDEVRIWQDIREAMAATFGDFDVAALDAAGGVALPAPVHAGAMDPGENPDGDEMPV